MVTLIVIVWFRIPVVDLFIPVMLCDREDKRESIVMVLQAVIGQSR